MCAKRTYPRLGQDAVDQDLWFTGYDSRRRHTSALPELDLGMIDLLYAFTNVFNSLWASKMGHAYGKLAAKDFPCGNGELGDRNYLLVLNSDSPLAFLDAGYYLPKNERSRIRIGEALVRDFHDFFYAAFHSAQLQSSRMYGKKPVLITVSETHACVTLSRDGNLFHIIGALVTMEGEYLYIDGQSYSLVPTKWPMPPIENLDKIYIGIKTLIWCVKVVAASQGCVSTPNFLEDKVVQCAQRIGSAEWNQESFSILWNHTINTLILDNQVPAFLQTQLCQCMNLSPDELVTKLKQSLETCPKTGFIASTPFKDSVVPFEKPLLLQTVPAVAPAVASAAVSAVPTAAVAAAPASAFAAAPAAASAAASAAPAPVSEPKDVCTICLTNARDTVMMPCRHLAICNECIPMLKKDSAGHTLCPICRDETKPITLFNV